MRTLFYGWGEGLEQVGAWLNQQPGATELHAISWYADGSRTCLTAKRPASTTAQASTG
ncbi:MAG: hypothetical protein R3A10_02325 [Caldilineaceae bacterium]